MSRPLDIRSGGRTITNVKSHHQHEAHGGYRCLRPFCRRRFHDDLQYRRGGGRHGDGDHDRSRNEIYLYSYLPRRSQPDRDNQVAGCRSRRNGRDLGNTLRQDPHGQRTGRDRRRQSVSGHAACNYNQSHAVGRDPDPIQHRGQHVRFRLTGQHRYWRNGQPKSYRNRNGNFHMGCYRWQDPACRTDTQCHNRQSNRHAYRNGPPDDLSDRNVELWRVEGPRCYFHDLQQARGY